MKRIVSLAILCLLPLAAWAGPEPKVGSNAAPRMAVAPVVYPRPEQLTPVARKRLQAERAMIAREMAAITRWKSTFGQRVVRDYVKPMDNART